MHFAVGADRGLDEHAAADLRRHGGLRIDGLDVLDLPGPGDSVTDSKRAVAAAARSSTDDPLPVPPATPPATPSVAPPTPALTAAPSLGASSSSRVQLRCLTALRAVRRPGSRSPAQAAGPGARSGAGEGRSTDFRAGGGATAAGSSDTQAGIRSDTSICARGVRSARAALAASSSSTRITITHAPSPRWSRRPASASALIRRRAGR